MGFLDFFDLLDNASKATNIPSLIKIHFEKFRDKNEYKGERIKSFIAFVILCLCFALFTIVILFVLYKILLKLKS